MITTADTSSACNNKRHRRDGSAITSMDLDSNYEDSQIKVSEGELNAQSLKQNSSKELIRMINRQENKHLIDVTGSAKRTSKNQRISKRVRK